MKIKSMVTVGMIWVLFLGSTVTTLDAKTCVWTGSLNELWSDAGNWEGGETPTHYDTVIFPNNETARRNTKNNISSLRLYSLLLNGGGYLVTGFCLYPPKIIDTSDSTSADNTITCHGGEATQTTIETTYQGSTLIFTGQMSSDSFIIKGGGTTVFRGAITGDNTSLTKQGLGTLEIRGLNTYSGPTIVSAGTLALYSTVSPLGSSPSLSIGTQDGSVDSAIVRLYDNIWLDNLSFTFYKTGWLEVVGNCLASLGPVIFNGGHISSHSLSNGRIALENTITVNASASEALLEGIIYVSNSETTTFNIKDGPATVDLRVNAIVAGGSFTKTGPGVMGLYTRNVFDKGIVVNQGTLRVAHDQALGVGGSENSGIEVIGLGLIQLDGVNIENEFLKLSKPTGTGTALSAVTDSTWAGPVTLAQTARIGADAGKTLTVSGVISGAGGLVIDGPGDLILAGTANNTYTGATQVNNNRLILNKSNNALAISQGSLTIGDGTGLKKTAIVQELAGHQIGSIPVLVDEDGLLDLNNCDDTIGNLLTLKNGSTIQTGTGTLTLLDNNQILCTYSPEISSVFHGKLNIGNGSCAINLDRSYLTSYASISGSGDIQVMSDSGSSLSLNAANTFSGTLTVGGNARLVVADSLSLGSVAGGTVINDQASLRLYNNLSVAEPLTMNSSYSYAIHPNRGLCVWTGPITLLHDTAILFSTADLSLNLAGPISGEGGLIRRNRGTLILSAANSYKGDTTINVGVLEIAHSDAICYGKITIGSGANNPSSVIVRSSVNYPIYQRVNVDIKSDGLLELNGEIGWINNLAFDRGQLTTGTGLLKLMGNVTATENSSADWSARFSGKVKLYHNHSFNIAANASFDFSANLEGSGGITKIGAGTLNLSGANTFTGNTVVNGGLLQVNGSQASSAVTVGSAGTLGGNGTVGSIHNSGTVAPGMSPGQLTTGSVALQSGSIFEVELDGTPSADGDRINTTGAVDLGESSLSILWGFEPSVGDSFTIIDNDGADAVVNIFSGLTNGATVVVGQVEATIHYDGGTGNDVVLSVVALRDPEPLQISSVAVVGETLQLAWTGGASQYYAVEKNTTLTNENWNIVANLTNTTHATLPITTTNGFYRVKGSD